MRKVIILVMLLIILLIPIRNHEIDRTISYSSLTYKMVFENVRDIGPRGTPPSVTKGTIIYVFGVEVFNNTQTSQY